MTCKAKEINKVPQYYCYGYIDKMTDELLPECKECQSHVYKAQNDVDNYNRRIEEEDKHD